MKLRIHCQTSTVAPLKYRNGKVISARTGPRHRFRILEDWPKSYKEQTAQCRHISTLYGHNWLTLFLFLCDVIFYLKKILYGRLAVNIFCPACRTTLIATRFWVVMICPIIKCLTVLRVFFYFVWFVFIHHNFQFYFKLCTYCNILNIYLS